MKFFAQPQEIPFNYIHIPRNLGQCELYYFERIDLVFIYNQIDVFVYKIQDNILIQNEYTQQQQQLINTNNRFLRRFSFSEETEQIYVYVQDKLFVINKIKNQFQQTLFQINQKFKFIESFKVFDKLFLAYTDKQIYISRRYNLKYLLRFKSKEEIHEIINHKQIIIINHHNPSIFRSTSICRLTRVQRPRGYMGPMRPSNISIFLKQNQNIKLIRKLYYLNDRNSSFSSNVNQLLKFDHKNESYDIIDLNSLQKTQTFQEEEYQIYQSPYFIRQLGIFVIHVNSIKGSEPQQQYIQQNLWVQTITTKIKIRFIKYSERYGLLVFY